MSDAPSTGVPVRTDAHEPAPPEAAPPEGAPPVRAPFPPRLPPPLPDRVTVLPPTASVPCVGCGYELRGLPGDAVCPECARPVSESRALVAGELPAGRVIELAALLRRMHTIGWWSISLAWGAFAVAFVVAALMAGGREVVLFAVMTVSAALAWWFVRTLRDVRPALSDIAERHHLEVRLRRTEISAGAVAAIATVTAIIAGLRIVPSPLVGNVLPVIEPWVEQVRSLGFLVLLWVHVAAMAPVLSFLMRQTENRAAVESLQRLMRAVPWIIGLVAANWVVRVTKLNEVHGLQVLGLLGLAFWGVVFIVYRYLGLLQRSAKDLRSRLSPAAGA
ncbi:MAG: hypothetical protein SFY69_05615 [Planctomycetota bacterium]|nr:hypothetical protein [Planctomycetota bacterium]